VLQGLMAAGHLPIRKIRLTVLDVGAGPAPALYAVRDFYDDLRIWIENVGQNLQVAALTDAHALDRGPAWDGILHELSEEIIEIRRSKGAGDGSLPFRRTHDDLGDFSVREVHLASRESAVRRVMYEFDIADEPISRHWAEIFATQEGKYYWAPSAYDIVVLCNFLTNPTITGQFAREIRNLGRSLTPGGILIALGGTGSQYPAVWSRLDTILRVKGLSKLNNLSVPMRANDDPARRELIRERMFDSMRYIFELCSQDVRREVQEDTGMLPRDKYAELEFRPFQVQCWKNQVHRRVRR
jgi:SAM-dependent methyltransferase